MKRIFINWNVNLIQQVRLVHALSESDYDVFLKKEEIPKFQLLKSSFGIRIGSNDSDSIDITKHLNFSHKAPLTRIGELERPLIFPKTIASACKTLWPQKREHKTSFLGLVTTKRKKLISDWISSNYPSEHFKVKAADTPIRKLKGKLLRKVGKTTESRSKVGDLLFWSSDRGRFFPTKAWDTAYYENMANTEFVLCPSGDCIWSYRFFEATLCGAIPIVEESCPAYEEFQFYNFMDPIDSLTWSQEMAKHNYTKCIELLTVPADQLNASISEIIHKAEAHA